MSLSTLPKEILHDIVSHFSGDFHNLQSCARVCRTVSEVATAALYKNIDFSIEERDDVASDEKTKRRQLRLLRSIAENLSLGAFVKYFKNHESEPFGRFEDATLDPDDSMAIRAAKNMTFLNAACLTPNQLSAHILANLQDYSKLSELEISGLRPSDHIWAKAPVFLTSLKWDIPTVWNEQPLWNTVNYLVNVIESTCPELEYLDIRFYDQRSAPYDLPKVSERVVNYSNGPEASTPKLTRLRHFGLRYQYQNPEYIEKSFLEFVKRHHMSLRSICIPTGHGTWTREMLDFVLSVCLSVSNLNELILAPTDKGPTGKHITGYQFLYELTSKLGVTGCSIERFTIANIDCPFSPTIGQLFHAWPNLKFLQIGDRDNENGPYDDSGSLDFPSYALVIKEMIKALPDSLTELYLEINGEGLVAMEDSDFDPICGLGLEIFQSRRRLHTCDIHAWIGNMDGGVGQYPEKAVFYRRLPYHTAYGDSSPNTLDSKLRAMWTSRMECEYQENHASVIAEYVRLRLEGDQGVFEGDDANEAWGDGYDYAGDFIELGNRRLRGDNRQLDFSWPFWKDTVGSYPMFRRRY